MFYILVVCINYDTSTAVLNYKKVKVYSLTIWDNNQNEKEVHASITLKSISKAIGNISILYRYLNRLHLNISECCGSPGLLFFTVVLHLILARKGDFYFAKTNDIFLYAARK